MFKKKKSGSSRNKKSESPDGGGHIAAALMPNATLAAVPRSPPPPPDALNRTLPDLDLKLSSTVLNASLLGRLANTDPGPSHVASETDTSLYDYEQAKEAYSTQEFATGKIVTLPIPPNRNNRELLTSDGEDMPSDLEVVNEQATYLIPKHQRPRDMVDDVDSDFTIVTTPHDGRRSASMQQFINDDESALKRSLSPHRGTSEIMERVEAQIVNSAPNTGMLSASPKTSAFFPQDDLSHTASLKLQDLANQNAALMDQVQQQNAQQQGLRDQLAEQHKQQEELVKKLKEQGLLSSQNPEETMREVMASMDSTRKSTENTVRSQSTLIASITNRASVLEQEKLELKDLNDKLQTEINELRQEFFSIQNGQDLGGSQNLMLQRKIMDYKDEIKTLKTAIQRLNVELSRYQARYRKPSPEDNESIGLPTKGPIPSWLINTKYLSPLILAYDDQIKEKDSIIRHYENEMNGFADRVDEILKENKRLHIRIEESDSGPVGNTEWRQLQKHCKLVIEENQLLLEQIQVQQGKVKHLQKVHIQEVSRLEKKATVAESERTQMLSELENYQSRLSDLRQKYDNVVINSSSQIHLEEHVNVVQELKRSRDEEGHKLEIEMKNLQTKLQSIEKDYNSMVLEKEDLKKENSRLEVELKISQKLQRKQQKRITLQQRLLAETESNEQSANHKLSSLVKIAQQTAEERDRQAEIAHNQERQKKKAMSKLVKGSVAREKMQEKMKLYRLRLSEQLEKASARLKEQDAEFTKQKSEYERECQYLRGLIKDRDELVTIVESEKRQVDADLEVMWQSATEDNRKMRETMQKSLQRLKQYPGINAAIMETDSDNIVDVKLDCD